MNTVSCSEDFRDPSSEDKLRRLLEVRREVLSALRDYGDALGRIRSARNLDVHQVLKFADNISLSLSAPRLWQPGHPLCGSLPPAPQLEDLRVGAMADYNKRLLEQAQKILSLSSIAAGVSQIDESESDGLGSGSIDAVECLRTPGMPVNSSLSGYRISGERSVSNQPSAPMLFQLDAAEGAVPSAISSSTGSGGGVVVPPRPPVRRVDINMGLDSDSD